MKRAVLTVLVIVLFLGFVSALELPAQYPTETILSKQIPLSPTWQGFLQTLFKLPADMVLNLQSTVLLAVLFLIVFFILTNIVGIIPFFEGNLKSSISALILTVLASLGGGMYYSLQLLIGLSDFVQTAFNLSFLSAFAGIALIIPIAFLIVVAVIAWVVLRGIRKVLSKEQAKEAGFEIGKTVAESKMYSKIFKESVDEEI